MVGRHSKPKHRPQSDEAKRQRTRTIEMVDTVGTAHFLTIDAAVDGRPRGRYTAMCREEILPGALVARRARWCPLCIPVPTQRDSHR
jgi:hypothetical protein